MDRLNSRRKVTVFMLLFVVPFVLLAVWMRAKAQGSDIPPQAQASAMAVPEPGLEYASALLVVHCRKVEALVLIDSHGEQHPYHGKEATLAQVLTMLSPVPADKVTQVTIACPGELGM